MYVLQCLSHSLLYLHSLSRMLLALSQPLSLLFSLVMASLSLGFAYCRQLSKALQLECAFVPVAVVVVAVLVRPSPAAAVVVLVRSLPPPSAAVVVVFVGGWCCFLAGWLLFCCVVSLEYDAACLCVCVCVCLCANVVVVFSLAESNESGWLFAGPRCLYTFMYTHTLAFNCYAFCVVIVVVVL